MRHLTLALILCGTFSMAAAAQSTFMGSFVIEGEPPKPGFELERRKPAPPPAIEEATKPRDLVRRSFRRALLRTASRL